MNFTKTTLLISLLVIVSCKNSNKEKTENIAETITVQNSDNAPIVLTIDGNTRTISAKERVEDTINFNEHPVKTLFRKKHSIKDDQKFEINLNFYENDIQDKIPVTYTLPQDNSGDNIKIDLNLFDSGRNVEKSMNKRLIFEEGTITIYELSRSKIHFVFDGKVHEMVNIQKKSTVSGEINVKY